MLNLLKWLIYRNDYLRFYTDIENMDQKENLGDVKLYKSVERSAVFANSV